MRIDPDRDGEGWTFGGSLDALPSSQRREIVAFLKLALDSYQREFCWGFVPTDDDSTECHDLEYSDAATPEDFWHYEPPIELQMSPEVFLAALDRWVQTHKCWHQNGPHTLEGRDKLLLLDTLYRWRRGIDAAIDKAMGLPWHDCQGGDR